MKMIDLDCITSDDIIYETYGLTEPEIELINRTINK